VMSNRAAFRAVVYGLVQGVNYRYFVQRNAESFGLTGYVCNLDDGSVEVIAEGDKEKLAQLIAKLKAGPRTARVDDVDVTWLKDVGRYTRFEVRF
jgi:acylphosphatase